MRATILATAVGLAFALHFTGASAAELPVGLVEMLGEVNATLDDAETALGEENFAEADDLLERADDTLYEAERRFSDQVPEDHPDLVAVWERFDKVRVGVRAAKRAAMAGSAEAPPETSDRVNGVARTFLSCTEARDTLSRLDRRARDMGWPVIELAAGHYPMLTMPRRLATVLHEMVT